MNLYIRAYNLNDNSTGIWYNAQDNDFNSPVFTADNDGVYVKGLIEYTLAEDGEDGYAQLDSWDANYTYVKRPPTNMNNNAYKLVKPTYTAVPSTLPNVDYFLSPVCTDYDGSTELSNTWGYYIDMSTIMPVCESDWLNSGKIFFYTIFYFIGFDDNNMVQTGTSVLYDNVTIDNQNRLTWTVLDGKNSMTPPSTWPWRPDGYWDGVNYTKIANASNGVWGQTYSVNSDFEVHKGGSVHFVRYFSQSYYYGIPASKLICTPTGGYTAKTVQCTNPYIVPVFDKFGAYLSLEDLVNNHKFSDDRDFVEEFNDTVFSNYVGPVEVVTDSWKDKYPEDGVLDNYHYKLQPQLTKFIKYFQDTSVIHSVTLDENRYAYTHEDQITIDHSLDNTICGTAESTNEDSIPMAYWTRYEGAYLGDSIPQLGIVEDVIPPSEILGVPAYEKQVNTSDTLKYGTVASASLTFNLNMPVDDAMAFNNELLVLFYDFEHTGVYENFGFFYIDSIEVLDEYTSHLTAHDEVYKLNKYADDFLITQTTQTTLLGFYHALLDYCNCCYDSHETIGNATFALDNIYNATKTTGIEVAHFVANIAPGFIHANAEGDVVLQEYKAKSTILTNSDYTDLKYNAYNTDILDKVRIVNNNTILGEDSGTGEKIYYIKDNPLIKVLTPQETINTLSNDILARYKAIPIYRPATVHFLVKPDAETGDVITVVSQTNQAYNIAIMRMSVNESGLEMESLGTATFPVEADNNAQLSNLSNNIDEIHTDIIDIGDNITDINEAISTLNDNDIALDNAIDAIGTRLANVEDATSLNTNFRNTFGTNNSVSTAQNLGTVKINGNSVNNFAMKGYVDAGDSSTLSSAESYSDTNLQAAKNYTDTAIANMPIVSRRNINYVCSGEFSGTNCDAWFLRFGNYGGIMYTLDSKHYIFTQDYVQGTGMGGEYWFYGDKTVWVTFNDD